ncbi:WD repeat-containing protein RUP2 [Forsythia ovata]|uniref:WD repeat-containing protein RUP2 n=1 Tax=Forsythia ovata TaxID=205694 RepID=A0ABD1X682_9LAMI
MKNFSSHFLQDPNKEIPETRQKLGKEEKKQEEERARCEWEFNLCTVVSSPAINGGTVSDTLGVIEFDPSDSFLATGGISRKIRIYSVKSLFPYEGISKIHGVTLLDHATACDYYICTPAKLSSLRWKPRSGGRVLGSGDYDGVVMEYDLERRVPVFERDEHGGRRVWSIDYSHWDPIVGASGSDDGTMQMWDPRCGDEGKCLAAVQPNTTAPSSVCCVEFNPFGGALVAVGCADRKVYGYDIRRMADPIFVFDGHQKAVTYIKFLDFQTIITSAIDGCLKMWNSENQQIIRTYKGHINSRRFVGLSVWRGGGLLCCGSENNQVFVYDKRWSEPIWVQGFEPVAAAVGGGGQGCDRGFVSGVSWRQTEDDRCILVAAGGSGGILQVFECKKKVMQC